MSNAQSTQGMTTGTLGATVNPYERVEMGSGGTYAKSVRASAGTHICMQYGVSGDRVALMPIAGTSEIIMKADGAIALGATVYTSATDGLCSATSTSAVKLGKCAGANGVAATASGDLVTVQLTRDT